MSVSIERDGSTGFPLLSQSGAVLDLILAYLALPYSISEYGCGKRASMIIDHLLALEIPPYAIWRGLAMERDMSPEALAEEDWREREHAIVVPNSLCEKADLTDPVLRRLFSDSCPGLEIEGDRILTGPFVLHHAPRVQFAVARSHVYPVLRFWDEENGRVVDRVIDPTLETDRLFPPLEMRELLNAPECLLLEAPLLGHLILDERYLTATQRREVEALLGEGCTLNEVDLEELSVEGHAAIVRALCGAERGSIGDPATWTYANNILGGDEQHDRMQRMYTGRGDPFRTLTRELVRSRESRSADCAAIEARLRVPIDESDVHRVVQEDAAWSSEQLEPLAEVAVTVAYYATLRDIEGELRKGNDLLHYLQSSEELSQARGLGVRLRRRIDQLAKVSLDSEGRIDARALTPGFFRASVETIRQMNRAGLTVAVDRAGSIHGMLLSEDDREALRQGRVRFSDLMDGAISFCSHIDTVLDGGMFDGRLGVASGIEVAHTLNDLRTYLELDLVPSGDGPRICVSAFIGEEMSFTGGGVSMPGSAAVTGRASLETIYGMTDGDGNRFGEKLVAVLEGLRDLQSEGRIDLACDLKGVKAGDSDGLLAACFQPGEFYTPHTYERHIEQGPDLDRAGVPMVPVGTVMGIHQEDFGFEGERSDEAGLEMNRRLRALALEEAFENVRITVGILQGDGLPEWNEDPALVTRWTLSGELNHAGATRTMDRRDAGVAIARLAGEFRERVAVINAERTRAGIGTLRPNVNNIHLEPGINRNVIPGRASVSLAVEGPALTEEEREELQSGLEGYIYGTLARRVASGGEGVGLRRVEDVSYSNFFRQAHLSIDLRAESQDTIDAFRDRITGIVLEIEDEFGVEIRGEIRQKLRPLNLEESGQVLMIERSYGGSHNSEEAQILNDIIRGTVLQLTTALQLIREGSGTPVNLFARVDERIPGQWKERMRRYTSGALHDTCNIAARGKEGSRNEGN